MGLLEFKWLKVNVKTKEEFTCHPQNCISHPPSKPIKVYPFNIYISSKSFFQKFQILFGAKTSAYILFKKNNNNKILNVLF
jgi:hypothetical protein